MAEYERPAFCLADWLDGAHSAHVWLADGGYWPAIRRPHFSDAVAPSRCESSTKD